MREHEKNARAIAEYLENIQLLKQFTIRVCLVIPQFDLAKSQMTGFGGMVSFVVKGGLEAAKDVVNNTKLFQLAEEPGRC